MWQLNSGAPLETITITDPYAEKMISRQPDYFISKSGSAAGDLNEPRGIHIAQDGSIFVADSNNNRIQQFSQTGDLLNSWGTLCQCSGRRSTWRYFESTLGCCDRKRWFSLCCGYIQPPHPKILFKRSSLLKHWAYLPKELAPIQFGDQGESQLTLMEM